MKLAVELINREYLAGQVAGAAGTSLRTLQSWVEKSIIAPGISDTTGKGSKRAFDFYNLVEAALVQSLSSSGVSLKIIQVIIRGLSVRLDDGQSKLAANLAEDFAYMVVRLDGLSQVAGLRVLSWTGDKMPSAWAQESIPPTGGKTLIIDLGGLLAAVTGFVRRG